MQNDMPKKKTFVYLTGPQSLKEEEKNRVRAKNVPKTLNGG